MMIVVCGVSSQPALGAGLTAVSDFVKAFNSHCICLKELFDDVAVSIVKLTTQISPSKRGEIAHPIDEKLRVRDAVVLFQLVEELFSRIAASMPRKSCVEDYFRIPSIAA
ncbi:hypothetical protein [Salinarchaeum sp. IM2453]|uniref:hypothetical protein n=1 Tax=Salinarchaeum sp. IM2453 TaxID=2862870 RepID=UPI0021049B42